MSDPKPDMPSPQDREEELFQAAVQLTGAKRAAFLTGACLGDNALRQRLEVSAFARAALFTNQIPAFAAAPSVYRQRAYFQMFAAATASARKYILLVTNTSDVVIFNLEDKIREDLLNLNVPSSPNNPSP